MSGASVTAANFDSEVGSSKIPVLVDFWAEWCMPCKMISPVIDAIAAEYEGKLKVVKVNIDEEAELANQFGIVSIPTLMVFKGGKAVRNKVGALPRQEIEKLFKDLIG
jgi:thioredoxin 1